MFFLFLIFLQLFVSSKIPTSFLYPLLGADGYMVERLEFEQSTVSFVLPVIPRFVLDLT